MAKKIRNSVCLVRSLYTLGVLSDNVLYVFTCFQDLEFNFPTVNDYRELQFFFVIFSLSYPYLFPNQEYSAQI